MTVENSVVKQELTFKLPSSGEGILNCLGTQEKGEGKDIGEKLSPKGEAFQSGFLITREGDTERRESGAACSWEGRLLLDLNEPSCLCS